ncbi:MAG: hypothetical protein ACRDP3_24050 [Streptomyces sp.]|uniref:hypothetical protein n=1 Tax=Streptomyces sp. TaxID=1931 RepID=UPI003D6C2F9A
MLQQQSPRRAPYLPLITLAGTVALAVGLPLAAATAGPADSSVASPGDGEKRHGGVRTTGADGAHGAHGAGAVDGGPSGPGADRGAAVSSAVSSASCGPEVATPEGLEAQTCVRTEEQRTWARTYYRNATDSPLRAVLILMRPDGSSMRAHCALPAADEPGLCETPRERLRAVPRAADGRAERYSAMAEIGSADQDRMLLRSGSNSPMR